MRIQWVGLLFVVALLTAAWVAGEETASDRLRHSLERRQQLESKPRSLGEILQSVADDDPDFDPDADAALVGPMRSTYNGLQYLLNKTLREQFLGLSSDSLRREWLRRYWLLRDPTPTTPENERLIEHERRVQFAREQFFIATPPHWDDRGAFFIQYGPPDGMNQVPSDVRAGVGYIPETLFWYYADGGILVPFEQRPPGGPWVFGNSRQSFTSRPDIARSATQGMRDFLTGYGLPATADDADRPTLSEVSPLAAANVSLSMAAAREVLEKRHERFVFPGMPVQSLWFAFDTVAFRRDDGTTIGDVTATGHHPLRVEAHAQFLVQDLKFEWQDSLYATRYRLEGVLFDADLQEAARDAYDASLTAREFDTTQRAQLYPGQLNFDVPPGRYRLAIRILDLPWGNQGSYTTDITVPDLQRHPLALSEIELATAILPAAGYGGSRFAKHGRLVMPNPISSYLLNEPLTAYFEIYGLTLDRQGTGRYRISYQILPSPTGSSRRHQPRPSVTSSFVSETLAPDSIEELRIDIAALQEAVYDLVIELQDLVGGDETQTRTRFSVLHQP